MNTIELLKKYDVPAPRYTSYPTVPYWSTQPTTEDWINSIELALNSKDRNGEDPSWSIYLHLPFCETLCTFCGCNTSITKDHDREEPYIKLIHSEFLKYLELVPKLKEIPLKEIHMGGGSPTFFSSDNLEKLVKPLFELTKRIPEDFEAGIEVDPRRANKDQLVKLYNKGFRRISLGIQDFNPETQRLVNRIQPLEMTQNLYLTARELGYNSINFDLIYGLPKQNRDSIRELALKTVELKPDRIALYSFALVPWIKPAQRIFKDEDLPSGELKRELYEIARDILIDGGYVEIGMDHFALPSDALAKSYLNGRMHRNFMGYTDKRTTVMIGLGVSAISESPTCFHQNEKVLPVYERLVLDNKIPTFRGHLLSDKDVTRREQVLEFMTKGEVQLIDLEQENDLKSFLKSLIQDDLVIIENQKMKITPKGLPFLRNACMGLDDHLRTSQPQTKVFSQVL